MRAWVLLDHGDVDDALAAATESVALAEHLDQSALVTIGNAVLGSALLAAGRPAEARPLIAAYDVEPGWICRWAPRLVEAELALGDVDGAPAVGGSGLGVWPPPSGCTGRWRRQNAPAPMVALARGDLVDAGTAGGLLGVSHAHVIHAQSRRGARPTCWPRVRSRSYDRTRPCVT